MICIHAAGRAGGVDEAHGHHSRGFGPAGEIPSVVVADGIDDLRAGLAVGAVGTNFGQPFTRPARMPM
jgi:hypothetical protein